MKRLSYLDNAELLDYDRYNMIDLYRRWDPVLKVKFKFWDTVGDVRFLNSILQCMLSSEVIVAMYSLENNTYKDDKTGNGSFAGIQGSAGRLMSAHDTVEFLLEMEAGIRRLVSNTHNPNEPDVKNLKFAVLLVGISRGVITTKLREKNRRIFNNLQKQCKYLQFKAYPTSEGDPSQIFEINYKQNTPKMSSLVQILWSIYQMKKAALNSKFITDSRLCCGLIKIPNTTIYDISSSLEYKIKHQPFVLRKIEQKKNNIYHNIQSVKKNVELQSEPNLVKRNSASKSIGMYAHSLQQKEPKRQVVGGPIASVHHWQLSRPKFVILYRTICCLISGIFFPFLVVMQTTMFWCYCAEWGISNEGLSRLVSNYRISQYGTFLLDFLYPIFPRSQPDPAVESAINTGLRSLLTQKNNAKNKGQFKIDWFFRQTMTQKFIRTVIAFSIVLLATFLSYNFIYWFSIDDEDENDISRVETIGGMVWFVIIWFMMVSWYGHRVDVYPDVDAMFADEDRTTFRLHYKDTSYGNDIIHTNVEVFLRSYTFYHKNKIKKTMSYGKIFGFTFVALIYCMIPGLHRVFAENKPFLSRDNPYVVIRAILSNFVLILLAQYVFDKAFYSYFQQYAKLIFDVTTLIEIPGDDPNEMEDEYDDDDGKQQKEEEMFKKASYLGSGFEFLSLDDPENLISWLEIRSYAYVKGRQLFAELELFILFFCIIMIVQAGYIVLTVFSNTGDNDTGDDVEEIISSTFLCVIFMLIINFLWMMKVFILGTKFDQLQRRQQYALVNQMMCIRSEALTTAVFTGPIGWIELSVGTWKKLHHLLRERTGKYIKDDNKQKSPDQSKIDQKFLGAMLNWDIIQSDNDNEENEENEESKEKEDFYKKRFKKLKQRMKQYFYDEYKEEEKWKKMRSLQEDFDHYLELLMLAYSKVQQNSIHPKIFGLGLSGALMKTMATTMFTTIFAIIRFAFF